jgi:mRNA turnover protein 4
MHRIFFGKTKVMAKALGNEPTNELLPNIHELTTVLKGSVGLLMTNHPPDYVLEHLDKLRSLEYARAGVIAPRDVVVPAGVVHSTGGTLPEADDVPLPHSMEVQLRKWGMPTRLVKGKIELSEPYRICKMGDKLNSNQTHILKCFGVALAEFRVKVKAHYSRATEKVIILEESGDQPEEMDEDIDSEDNQSEEEAGD